MPTDPPRALRRVLTPGWLLRHLGVAVVFVAFCGLGYWQWERAMAPHGTLQNLFYAFEWWVFAAVGLYGWWRTVRDEVRGRPAAVSGDSVEQAESWTPRPRRTERAASLSAASAAPGASAAPSASALSGAGTPDADEAEDAEDAELAAYNRYLAELHARSEVSAPSAGVSEQ